MATVQEIQQPAEWSALWSALKGANAPHVMLFKFSPRCPVSHAVERLAREYVRPLAEAPNVRFAAVDVVNARPISQQIAADTGVRHESPQALFIGPGGTVLWNDSHESVDEDALGKALKLAK